MPRAGQSKISKRVKTAVAERKLAGRTNAEIARELDLAPSTAARLSSDAEVLSIMERIMRRGEPKLDELFAATVDSLQADLQAAKFDERERARTQAMKLIEFGAPKTPPASENGRAGIGAGAPLVDFLATYRQLTVQAVG
jgi:hypothetical protein